MEELINLLHSGGYSCVIANGDNIRTFTQRGVADLLRGEKRCVSKFGRSENI